MTILHQRDLFEVLGNLSERKVSVSFAATIIEMIIVANVTAAKFPRHREESGHSSQPVKTVAMRGYSQVSCALTY